ncbi:retinoblastoma-like protein 1 [Tachyglossus aculeatus]|uniref:retinoblastoma-like protein 1 n=1 Tax=Tachyglossus aculeatus TaxID=9261 RepID=UPI0018F62159|nr:retinoblastoma-like protein 1 [Tachyglossus aculeatus]
MLEGPGTAGGEGDGEGDGEGPPSPREVLQALCHELKLDNSRAAEAVEDFTAIRATYSLEGDVVHWLACALYVACHKSVLPTAGKGGMEKNCVSLTRILRSAKLSLIQFFNKMKTWMDMSNLPQEFRERMGRLERNFEVSTVIFKKFEPIFRDVFQNPYEGPRRVLRSKRQRPTPGTAGDLFNFCWTLFVYTKGHFRRIGDDLVNSYHLLLCCLDLTYALAISCSNRRDLLNPSFRGLPPNFHSTKFKAPAKPPCVIATLCTLHDGLLVEAKSIKEYYFKAYMTKLFRRKILKGDRIPDPSSFAENSQAINKAYEEYVLTIGDFDERVFLGADAEEEIGAPGWLPREPPTGRPGARAHGECHFEQHFEKKGCLAPSTPLTGRRYLRGKEAASTPVASATQSVSKLQGIVAGLRNSPSEQLLSIFESCSRNPLERVASTVSAIRETFCHCYTLSTQEQPGSHIDFAVNRFKLAEVLYYKILESILVQEMRRLHGMDMSGLLEQDVFHRSLLACCLEIVLSAYSSPRTFPWVLDTLNINSFYFYKVIEVLIRSEEGLSRDMVKHLNRIEEQILESLAWARDSALWDGLRASDLGPPTCEDVMIPANFEAGNGGGGPGHRPLILMPPIMHPRVKEVQIDSGNLRRGLRHLSPISAHERFNSPAAGSAKRRLFGEAGSGERAQAPAKGTKLTIGPAPGTLSKTLAVVPRKTVITGATEPGPAGPKMTMPLHGISNLLPESRNSCPQPPTGSPAPLTAQALMGASPKHAQAATAPEAGGRGGGGGGKPRRTGSVALFFRKVYHLASVRLRDLCLKLDVSNDLRRKIWTCFEFTLVHCTDLLRDRHLDQLLLCAFYLMAKVTKEERTFQDIMKNYRNQPQANSYVYRSVLLKAGPGGATSGDGSTSQDVEMVDCETEFQSTPAMGEALGSPTPPGKEERGDIIQFYNAVYVKRAKSFALKYNVLPQDPTVEAPPLSPFPTAKQQAQPVSPRRVSQHHSVYVSPHKSRACLTPRTALLYQFQKSPSKSLKDINNMIQRGEPRSKKRALSIDGEADRSAKRLCQENDDVLLKRLQDVVSERANH